MRGRCLSVMVRDAQMRCVAAQRTVQFHTAQAEEMVPLAMDILHCKGFDSMLPYRSIGISMGSLEATDRPVQLDMLGQTARRDKLERLSHAVDSIHARFGDRAIQRGLALANPLYNTIVPKSDHLVHPIGWLQ